MEDGTGRVTPGTEGEQGAEAGQHARLPQLPGAREGRVGGSEGRPGRQDDGEQSMFEMYGRNGLITYTSSPVVMPYPLEFNAIYVILSIKKTSTE